MAYVLPVAPFEERIPFVRENKSYTAVRGINAEGFGFMYLEEGAPDPDGFTVRIVPVDKVEKLERGVCLPVGTYWEKELYLNGKFVKTVEGSRHYIKTNHPDMVYFTAGMGLEQIAYMFNGAIREMLGFDDQPLFRYNELSGKNEPVPDTEYDTTLGPVKTYHTHKVEETQPATTV